MAAAMIIKIPESLIREEGLNEDTILSAHMEDGKLVVEVQGETEMFFLFDFIDELTITEQYTVFGYLTSKLIGTDITQQEGDDDFYGE